MDCVSMAIDAQHVLPGSMVGGHEFGAVGTLIVQEVKLAAVAVRDHVQGTGIVRQDVKFVLPVVDADVESFVFIH